MKHIQCKHGKCKDHKPSFEELGYREESDGRAIFDWCCWRRKRIVVIIKDVRCKLCGRLEAQKQNGYSTVCNCCGDKQPYVSYESMY